MTGRRIGNGICGMVAILALALAACETTDRGHKMGESCTGDGDCETDTCFEGTCAKWGAACAPASGPEACNDQDPCTIDECAAAGKCFYRADTVATGCFKTGLTSCTCGETGVTIDPGTCTWEDAAQCSGWHSVVVENGQANVMEFANGTKLCAFDCCLTIRCP